MVRHKGKKVVNKPKAKHNSIVSGTNNKVITPYQDTGYRYPNDVLEIRREALGTTLHFTQKPVELLEWLIKTYTNEGELVLDNCIGSGTTAIACINTNRNYVGFELDKDFFEIAKRRIEERISNRLSFVANNTSAFKRSRR